MSVDECINFLTQFICTILILWQSIYFISDAAVESLLKLFSTVFQFLCKYSPRLETLVRVFPKNVYAMSKYIDSKKIQFLRYVVCKKCYKLYILEDCVLNIEGRKQSKLCNHISFPNHKLAYMRRPCNEPLLKDISETDGQLSHTCSDLSPHPGQIVNFLEHFIIMNGTVRKGYLVQRS